MAHFPTRAERLAAERARRRREAVASSPRLNPAYPHPALGFDPALFAARRVQRAAEGG